MTDLRPCPFCGGVAKLNTPGYECYSPCWCKCTQCGAEGPTKSSELEAEEGWNKRIQDNIENAPIIDSRMPGIGKNIKGLEWILEDDRFGFGVNWENRDEPRDEYEKAGKIITDSITLLKKQEEEIENLKQTAQSIIEGICLLKKQEEIPLRCKKCGYHREDGLCSMHRIYVKETDYCSLGIWKGQ